MDVRTLAGFSCTLFFGIAAAVLEQQTSSVQNDDFYRQPESQVARSHQVNVDICVSARNAVEEHNRSSENLESI